MTTKTTAPATAQLFNAKPTQAAARGTRKNNEPAPAWINLSVTDKNKVTRRVGGIPLDLSSELHKAIMNAYEKYGDEMMEKMDFTLEFNLSNIVAAEDMELI